MSNRNFLFILFILTITVRIPVVFLVGDKVPEHEFAVLVHNMRSGDGYSFFTVGNDGRINQHITHKPVTVLPTATVPPVYPLFLAAMYEIVGDTVYTARWIEIVQVLLAGLCCLLVYGIAHIKFSRRIAKIAGVLFALYPIFVYLPGQISAANAYIFLNCLLLYCLFRGEQEHSTRFFLVAGLVFGLLVLARAEAIAYLPFILIWIGFIMREHVLKRSLGFMVISILIVTPWIVRNYRVFHTFVPLTTQGGYNLWQGQNPDATGTRSQYTDPPFHVSAEVEQQITALPAIDRYELALQDIYLREAIRFMKNHPGRMVVLGLRKCMFYWGHYWGIRFTYPGAQSVLYWLPWFMLLPFFVVGIVQSLRTPKSNFLFYVYFIVSTLIVMTFFVIPRYRLFILPLMLPFAAAPLRGQALKFYKFFATRLSKEEQGNAENL